MKFTICQGFDETVLGSIDVSEDVYEDDDALLSVLADSGYIDRDEALDFVEEEDGRVDIVDSETNYLLISLILNQ